MRSLPSAFGADSQLVPRGKPGAMIEDADEAATYVLAMIEAKAVITIEGKHLPSPIDSICVHGDSAQTSCSLFLLARLVT